MDTFTSVILNFGTYLAQRPASGCSRLHTAAHPTGRQDHEGYAFPHVAGPYLGSKAWGGWDSNPGPADYESSPPATCPMRFDLGGHELT